MPSRLVNLATGITVILAGLQQAVVAAPSMPISDPVMPQLRGVQPCITTTHLVGDGDPHQNYKLRQVTEPTTCDPTHTCQTGYGKGGSFGVEVGLSGEYEWISGGFAVSKEWSEEEQHLCDGDPGDTVCVWYNMAYTAYTVQNGYQGDCLDVQVDPYVMWSPNTNNAGGGYYCVVGTCRNINAEYWDYNGRAGGP